MNVNVLWISPELFINFGDLDSLLLLLRLFLLSPDDDNVEDTIEVVGNSMLVVGITGEKFKLDMSVA